MRQAFVRFLEDMSTIQFAFEIFQPLGKGWKLQDYKLFHQILVNIGPIKVNPKMAFFGFEIWKPGKWNDRLGYKLEIENMGFETLIWKL